MSTKRGRRNVRRRSHRTIRRRHSNHVRNFAIRVHMASVGPIDRVTSYMVGILALLGSCLILQIWNLLNHWRVASEAEHTRTCQHISPPLHRSLRSRVQIPLPLQAGCRPQDCHFKNGQPCQTVQPARSQVRGGQKPYSLNRTDKVSALPRCEGSNSFCWSWGR